jgi:VanZ family protein
MMKLKRIIPAIIFWLLTVAMMFVIFNFSSDTGDESSQVSESLLSIIVEYLGNIISDNVLRKMAHFTEYAALGFCMSSAIYFTFNKHNFISLIPCFLYAVSDEIHQYFVPDRACCVFDVCIDTCGSLVGILIFLLIYRIVNKIQKRSCRK